MSEFAVDPSETVFSAWTYLAARVVENSRIMRSLVKQGIIQIEPHKRDRRKITLDLATREVLVDEA